MHTADNDDNDAVLLLLHDLLDDAIVILDNARHCNAAAVERIITPLISNEPITDARREQHALLLFVSCCREDEEVKFEVNHVNVPRLQLQVQEIMRPQTVPRGTKRNDEGHLFRGQFAWTTLSFCPPSTTEPNEKTTRRWPPSTAQQQ